MRAQAMETIGRIGAMPRQIGRAETLRRDRGEAAFGAYASPLWPKVSSLAGGGVASYVRLEDHKGGAMDEGTHVRNGHGELAVRDSRP